MEVVSHGVANNQDEADGVDNSYKTRSGLLALCDHLSPYSPQDGETDKCLFATYAFQSGSSQSALPGIGQRGQWA